MHYRGDTAPKVVDRVYETIKRLVINYDIKPGQQIHIEDLANYLNASVTPTREALNRLLNDGFVTRKSARGFYNRDIDIEELKDLFQLRGSLAISAFHFIFRTELKKEVPRILAEANDPNNKSQVPICASLIHAVGNKEMLRVYNNIMDKTHFIWNLYSTSPRGKADIAVYRESLLRLIRDEDLASCVDVIDDNIKLQISALNDLIHEGFGILFSQKNADTQIVAQPGKLCLDF